jgi:hypothetical protein
MTKVIAENLNTVMRYREKLFLVLTLIALGSSLFYAYFVHSAIVNVVEREQILKDIREKSTSVSVLESTYFSEKNKINIQLAHAKGFQDSEVSSYISKKSLTAFVVHNEL